MVVISKLTCGSATTQLAFAMSSSIVVMMMGMNDGEFVYQLLVDSHRKCHNLLRDVPLKTGGIKRPAGNVTEHVGTCMCT